MKKILKLAHPVMIDNKEVRELSYDPEKITSALYSEADTKRRIAAGTRNVAITPTAEFDFGLHPWVGMCAVIGENPRYSFEDLEKVRGTDMLELCNIGRGFLLKSEVSSPDASDEQSETTAELSTPQLPTSNDAE